MSLLAHRIGDHAVIGDGRSAALVARDGTIDWLCWPRFDSDAIFAAILDAQEGGSWSIAPRTCTDIQRTYVGDSNVLATTFETPTGRCRLVDLMPVYSEENKRRRLTPEHELLRMLEGVEGEVECEVRFQPRPEYGLRTPRLREARGLGIRVEEGQHLYTLRSDAELSVHDGTVTGVVRIRAGERRFFSLTYDADGPAVLAPLGPGTYEHVERTVRWWSAWARRCSYRGEHRDVVVRSLLALKLLSFAPSGAIVAAATTSLPERLGGPMNWDYRYCWVRDASMTVRVLHDLGYVDEAVAFVIWLLHTTRLTRPEIRVLYDVYGQLPQAERILTHLAGFCASRPVRVRNAASNQVQLDSYGEVIDAVTRMVRRGMELDRTTQTMVRELGEFVCRHWHQPDHGIWEPRGTPRDHTHSRLLCWTALDRMLELRARGVLGRVKRHEVEAIRARVRRDIESHAWSDKHQSYTATIGGHTVDASLLLMSEYGFAPPDDPRLRATYERIRERLGIGPALLLRNEQSRYLGEGAFGICGFWAVKYLADGGGTLAEAVACFEHLLESANDVGLFAEEVDPVTGEALGNFPQAFTHLGLVDAAMAIEERRAHGPELDDDRAPRAWHHAEVHP